MATSDHHWRVIRTLLVVLVAMVGWQMLSGAQVGAKLDAIRQKLEIDMKQLHFSKTLYDGTVVTYTATQETGEALAAFATRARAEWEEICEGLGA